MNWRPYWIIDIIFEKFLHQTHWTNLVHIPYANRKEVELFRLQTLITSLQPNWRHICHCVIFDKSRFENFFSKTSQPTLFKFHIQIEQDCVYINCQAQRLQLIWPPFWNFKIFFENSLKPINQSTNSVQISYTNRTRLGLHKLSSSMIAIDLAIFLEFSKFFRKFPKTN